jgi:hypothetical protein
MRYLCFAVPFFPFLYIRNAIGLFSTLHGVLSALTSRNDLPWEYPIGFMNTTMKNFPTPFANSTRIQNKISELKLRRFNSFN